MEKGRSHKTAVMFRYVETETTPGWASKDQEMTLGIRQGVNAGHLGDRRVRDLLLKCRPPTLSGIFHFFFLERPLCRVIFPTRLKVTSRETSPIVDGI